MTALTAFVEETHGFIRGPDLDLDKVRFPVMTHGTSSGRPIDVFPCRRSTQYVIDCFAGQRSDENVWSLDCARIRTRGAHPRLLWLLWLQSPTVVTVVARGGGGGVDGSHL